MENKKIKLVFASCLGVVLAFVATFGITAIIGANKDETAVVFDGDYKSEIGEFGEKIYALYEKAYITDKAQGEVAVNASPSKSFKYTSESDYSTHLNDIKASFNKDCEAASSAFKYDHPEIFWLGNSMNYEYQVVSESDSNSATISISSVSVDEAYPNAYNDLDAFNAGVDAAVAEINKSLSENATTYDKAKAIHDYICNNVDYDYEAAKNVGNSTYADAYTAAPLFVSRLDNKVVCEGYAKAFKILCDKFNIPCVLVSGTATSSTNGTGAHMWNYVQMDDGKWYAVDVTWDDMTEIRYDYFLVGNEIISNNHTANGKLSTDTNAYVFNYPTLSNSKYASATVIVKQQRAEKSKAVSNSDDNPDNPGDIGNPGGNIGNPGGTGNQGGNTDNPGGTGNQGGNTGNQGGNTNSNVSDSDYTSLEVYNLGDGNNIVKSAGCVGKVVFYNGVNDVVDSSLIRITADPITAAEDKQTLYNGIKAFDSSLSSALNDCVFCDINLDDKSGDPIEIVGSIRVVLNYPAGINYKNCNDYEINVYHKMSDGTIEKMNIKCTEAGIEFETGSFSPFILTYTPKSSVGSVKTGESAMSIYIAIMLVVTSAVAVAAVAYKRKNFSNAR